MAMHTPVPISASPDAGQLVAHEGTVYDTVREGRAYILIPPNTRTSVDPQAKAKTGDGSKKPQNVFYNPIQQFNRDLSVLAIKAFGEDLCEKRSLKYNSGKQQARKERKRQRKAAQGGAGEDEDEGHRGTKRKRAAVQEEGQDGDGQGVKLRKTDNGAAESTLGPTAGDDGEEEHGVEDAQEQTSAVGGAVNSGPASSDRETATQVEAVVAGASAADGTQDHHPGDGDKATPIVNADQAQQPPKPKFRILDALSATGLRAIRYATEIPFVTSITANDMDRNATKSIRTNVEHNKLGHVIDVNTANAMAHMYGAAFPPANSHGPNHINGKYDVIDLDPYGTAAPFIDSALQALNDGGLLCVTCTDSGVFASCGYSEKTFSLYGGMPVKGPHSHEGGLRIILHSIASSAAKYGLAIEPLLSLSIDFYVRMFIRVSRSPADVKFLAGRTMLVYDCDAGCGAWNTQMFGRNVRQTGKKEVKSQQNNPTFNFKHTIAQGPSVDRLCEHCHSKMHVAGPMWAGPLHNAAFVGKVLDDARAADSDTYQTKPRIEGMLDTALDELVVIDNAEEIWRTIKREDGTLETMPKTPPETLDLHPFFFIPSALSKVIHCVAPPEAAFKGALRHAGYRATRSHCKPGSIKTDAPWTVVWEVMREWVRQKQPIKAGALKEGLAGWHIMQAARKAEDERDGTAEGEESRPDDSPDIVTETAVAPAGWPPADPKRIKVVFDEVLGKDKPGKRLVRYQQNPRENWGPMSRAKGSA
ncbi:hypothetical protein LTR36_000476 [Oleoguttula mirabilis]|uniref:tRNA (guanine(26)-N(2))-dimethyltransferase n=1 Tax=Oleoguttula mirabilis TaxID=1507867 RepID=A0AAV9JRA3_9PEZI|nr:hypothetical protein LTR36_000476 [Oleoguttula mirabilis]